MPNSEINCLILIEDAALKVTLLFTAKGVYSMISLADLGLVLKLKEKSTGKK